MAAHKYFLVTRIADAVEALVRAPKPAQAIAAIAGDATAVRVATDDDIATFAGQLHPKSVEPGSGRYFVVGEHIVRAKNATSAYALVNEDAYQARLLNQDELVAQLQKGLKPVQYVEPAKPAKPAGGEDGAQGGTAPDDGAAAESRDHPQGASAGSALDAASAGEGATAGETTEAANDAAQSASTQFFASQDTAVNGSAAGEGAGFALAANG